MRLHYGGTYITDADLKMRRDPHPDAVEIKDPDTRSYVVVSNLGGVLLMILLGALVFVFGGDYFTRHALIMGSALGILTIFPHELIHAMCFRKHVFLYLSPARYLIFVHGTEDFSKARFIYMKILPNIIFGLIPYVAFLFRPEIFGLGVFGTLCIGMGFRDYINIIKVIDQMPRGAKTYLHGLRSYWYL
ncbi:MAG: DUF3267 domain-containing protein [Clostridiales bacterium]|nr:DUF3267 domain-containing protein [Clostridiales bacterium]